MFALVDCNNFYVSCERLFAPHLNGRPVIVLSNNDGCAIARSEEAKALGINMGTPAFMIGELIEEHSVHVFSSNYTLYGNMSARVLAVLQQFAPHIEIYSIDEAFLDLSSLAYEDLEALARRIRTAVYEQTGIPVSIGIGPTKTLSKMANRYAKKKNRAVGVHAVQTDADREELLRATAIGDVWGIGRQHGTRLVDMGIITAHDLLGVSDDWMRKNMTVVGQRMYNELKGISCIALEEVTPAKKNICTSRSFGKLTTDRAIIQEAIATHAASCARKLRQGNLIARKVHVFIQTNPHRGEDRQYFQSITLQLPVPTNLSGEVIKQALKGLCIIFRPGYNYMKVGVMALDLISDKAVQQNLFDQQDQEAKRQACRTFDAINAEYGQGKLKFASEGFGRKWRLKAEQLSPCYTTSLSQIKTIRI